MNDKPPRPSWALAYILQDWRTGRDVRKAYVLASADDDYDDLAKRASAEVLAAIREARETLAGYMRAIDAVLAPWESA